MFRNCDFTMAFKSMTDLIERASFTQVAMMYFGMGWVFAKTAASYFPEYPAVRSAVGLITFLSAFAWIARDRFRRSSRV